MSDADVRSLRGISFFSDLDDAALAAVGAACRTRSFPARQVMIGHKDESFDVLFLLAGLARVCI
jgi:CRP/FNR family cyclic AMP-dependent transcriptional regulator